MIVEEKVPLAPLTTFGIGGAAAFFARVGTVEELEESLDFARGKNLSVLLLGGGSNMLVSERGWDGLVIKIEIKGVELVQDVKERVVQNDVPASRTVIAGAGEPWDELVEKIVQENLWGIENLSGIPGTVGGAVVQNIGAYGAALSQTCSWVEVYNTDTNAITKMSNAECLFDYRDSIFKHHAGKYVVLRVAFELSVTPKPNTSYQDLAARFNDSSTDLQAIRQATLEIRKGKFPNLAVEGTAGSFFKNPIVSPSQARALAEQYPDMTLFAMPETAGVKVPLAWLLDKVLNLKGEHVGGARLFEKQPLVIVAAKNSSAHDVQTLAQKIKKEVKEKINIDIEEEVQII